MEAEAGRKAKIEVTPKMLDAGMRAFANYDAANWSNEETAAIIEGIYRAMERARH